MAVGNPFGLGESVTAGILSARNRNIDSGPYDDFLQTDASINKGNSGGPLFNMQGEVIGINTAILSPSGGSIGIGFATPSNTVEPVIEQLEQFGETRRGWLGVRIQPVDDSIADSLGLGTARGALIAGVDEKRPGQARRSSGRRRDRQVRRQGHQGIARSAAHRRLDGGRQEGRRRRRAQGQGNDDVGDARPARGRREAGEGGGGRLFRRRPRNGQGARHVALAASATRSARPSSSRTASTAC